MKDLQIKRQAPSISKPFFLWLMFASFNFKHSVLEAKNLKALKSLFAGEVVCADLLKQPVSFPERNKLFFVRPLGQRHWPFCTAENVQTFFDLERFEK